MEIHRARFLTKRHSGQSPMFTHRTAPVLVRRVLTVQHLKLYHPRDSVQLHRAGAPMHQPLAAQGENFAMLSGFCLQSLLESLTCPLASLAFHFHLNLSQGLGALGFRFHPFPFVEGSSPLTLRNRYTPIMRAVSRCARCEGAPGRICSAQFPLRHSFRLFSLNPHFT